MEDKSTIEKITAEHAKRLIEMGRFTEAEAVLGNGRRLAAAITAGTEHESNAA